jgi:hypothetical protein
VIIDIAENECAFRKIGQLKFGYNAICFDGDNFWLSPSYLTDGEARLMKWDGESRREYVTVPGKREGMKKDIGTAKRLFYANGYVHLIPDGLNGAYRINVKSGEFSVWDALRPECESESAPELYDKFNAAWQDRDTIYAQGSRSRALYVFNTLTGEGDRAGITGDSRYARAVAYRRIPGRCEEVKDCLYGEDVFLDVGAFAEMIVNVPDCGPDGRLSEWAAKEYMIGERGSGAAIYEYCKSLLNA